MIDQAVRFSPTISSRKGAPDFDYLVEVMTSYTYSLTQDSTTEQLTESAEEAAGAVNDFWRNDLVQEWLVQAPLKIAVILIVAIILHWALRRTVNRLARRNIATGGRGARRILPGRLARQDTEDTRQMEMLSATQEKRRQSRVKTISGVFNSAIAIVIWTWAIMAILSAVGVNVAPLIASAGVVGVAIGFGAQSLVKDFLSGIFMLIEDQYGIGDTIDVGDGIVGDVEEISLRVTTLRDIDGGLWYVRNGEILRIGNLSDGYAIARLQIPVGLDNDTETTLQIIGDAAREAVRDPRIADLVIEDPVINGVTDIQPDHVSYRVSIRTLPGDQWSVQRLAQAKVVNALRVHGVTMPYLATLGRPGVEKPDALGD